MNRAVNRVALKRSGGFAGLTQECQLEADELDADARAELEGFVAQAAVVSEADSGSPISGHHVSGHPACGADLFRYELRVTAESGERTFVFDDETLPDELAPVIDSLCARLVPVAKSGSQAQRK